MLEPMLKLNTVLTATSTLFLILVSYLGNRLWSESALTHDAVLTLQVTMVNHSQFDLALAEVRQKQQTTDAAIANVRVRQASIELEMQKLKHK
jgi:hypothetical protein